MRSILLGLILVPPGWCTWTLVQHKFVDTLGNTSGGGTCSIGATTCAASLTAVGANHLLICTVQLGNATQTINACTGDSTAFTHCASCLLASSFTVDDWYILSASGSETVVTCNFSANTTVYAACLVREYSTTAAPAIFDTGNAVQRTCTTSCSGVTLTLGGANDVLVQSALPDGTCTSITTYTNTDFMTSAGGIGDLLNTSSGAAPTWTCSSTTLADVNGIAFKETSGAGVGVESFQRRETILSDTIVFIQFRVRRKYEIVKAILRELKKQVIEVENLAIKDLEPCLV